MLVMLRTTLIAISFASLASALTWRNCSTHTSDAVTVTEIDVTPNLIVFPGDLHVNLNLTMNRQINNVFLDFEVHRLLFGFPVKIPCIKNSIIGSCDNVEVCHIFNSILNDPNNQGDYGHQAQTIMFSALGHYVKCPLRPETVLLNDAVVKLDAIQDFWHLLTDGDYTIKVKAKETKDGPYSLGCIAINATLGRTGAPVG